MNGPNPVAIAAPETPKFSVYMNIGSSIMFMIAARAIGIVALLISPSALNAPPNIGGINIAKVRENMIIP